MQKSYTANLPGFFIDAHGAYGMVRGILYFSCEFDPDDADYIVKVDIVDKNGNFMREIDQIVCRTEKQALLQLKHKLGYYSKLF